MLSKNNFFIRKALGKEILGEEKQYSVKHKKQLL